MRTLKAVFAALERNHDYENFRENLLDFEKKIRW